MSIRKILKQKKCCCKVQGWHLNKICCITIILCSYEPPGTAKWSWRAVAFLYVLCEVKTSYFSREITQANHDFSPNTNKVFLCLSLTRALALHCDNREIQNQTKQTENFNIKKHPVLNVLLFCRNILGPLIKKWESNLFWKTVSRQRKADQRTEIKSNVSWQQDDHIAHD